MTGIGQHIDIIAQDENERQRVKQYGDVLGKIGNEIKGMAQRLQEQMQKQQQAGPQTDPELESKIMAQQKLADAKVENNKNASAQRTAQKQIAFEKEQMRKDAQLQAELQREQQRTAVELKLGDVTAANQLQLDRATTLADIRNEHIKAANKPKPKPVDKKSKKS